MLCTDTWSQQGHSVPCVTMYFQCLQITNSDIRPQIQWLVSLLVFWQPLILHLWSVRVWTDSCRLVILSPSMGRFVKELVTRCWKYILNCKSSGANCFTWSETDYQHLSALMYSNPYDTYTVCDINKLQSSSIWHACAVYFQYCSCSMFAYVSTGCRCNNGLT